MLKQPASFVLASPEDQRTKAYASPLRSLRPCWTVFLIILARAFVDETSPSPFRLLGLRVQRLKSERSNLIAELCGPLKSQLFGGSFHFRLQPFDELIR